MKQLLFFMTMWFVLINLSFATEVVSMKDFIKSAKKVNVGLTQILNKELQVAFNRRLSLDDSKITLSASAYRLFEYDENYSFLALSKMYQKSATELDFSLYSAPSTDLAYSLKVTQPLLKNNFGSLYEMAEKREDISDELISIEVKELYEDHIALLMSNYYDLYLFYINLKSAERVVKESEKLLSEINLKYEAKIASLKDVNLIKVQLIEDQSQLESAQLEYQKQKNIIKYEFGIDNNFNPMLNLPEKFVSSNIDEVIDASRKVKFDKLVNKKSKINIEYYEADLLPEFDVYAQRTDQETEIGLNYLINFGNDQANAQLEQAMWTYDDDLISADINQRSLVVTLHYLEDRLFYLDAQISKSAEMLDLYSEIVKEEQHEYKIGRTSLDQLVRYINNKNSYEKLFNTNVVLRYKTYTEWLRLTDDIVE